MQTLFSLKKCDFMVQIIIDYLLFLFAISTKYCLSFLLLLKCEKMLATKLHRNRLVRQKYQVEENIGNFLHGCIMISFKEKFLLLRNKISKVTILLCTRKVL